MAGLSPPADEARYGAVMDDVVNSDLPTVGQLHAQQGAALDQLRQILGEHRQEVRTAGELAELLSRIPAETPLTVAEHVRIDPDLDENSTESRTAVGVISDLVFTGTITPAVDGHGRTDVHALAVAALQLGAVRVAQDGTVPARTVACEPAERVVEAMYTGDGRAMMTAFQEILLDVAGRLDGHDDGSLLEWIADPSLVQALELEGTRLRHAAARLDALTGQVGADLAAQDTAAPDAGGSA